MTYRLDADIHWFYGETVDRSTGEVIAPGYNVKWKQPDQDFYGK